MDTNYLEEIKAREQAAMPTAENIQNDCGGYSLFIKVDGKQYKAGEVYLKSDAEFITHAHADIKALLAEVERLKKDLVDSKKKAEYCRNKWHASTDRIFYYLNIIDKIREIDESSVKEACISLGDTEFGYEQEEAEK